MKLPKSAHSCRYPKSGKVSTGMGGRFTRGSAIKSEEIKNSLKYIEKNIKRDDAIYVYYGYYPAFEFYKEIKIININNAIIVGIAHRNENHEYDQELLNLRGKVWLLFSHVYPFGNNKDSDSEEKYMMEFLLSKGVELLDVKKYRGSSVYYVDTKKPKPADFYSMYEEGAESMEIYVMDGQ